MAKILVIRKGHSGFVKKLIILRFKNIHHIYFFKKF